MEKETAVQHLKFMQEVVVPLYEKGKTDIAADKMQEYCRLNPDLINLYANSLGEYPDYHSNFEPCHMESDIKSYVDLLKDVVESQ